MKKKLNLRVGEMAVCCDSVIVRTVGIGSCVVIGMYDKEKRIGGMLHSMLPNGSDVGGNKPLDKIPETSCKYRAKYVDESIEFMVKMLLKKGASIDRLVAKMTGGAVMLKSFDTGSSVGERNLETAREKLKELGVRIKGEATGGTVGRMADFNLSNGILSINIKI